MLAALGIDPTQILPIYGYIVIGLLVGLESASLPLPGETALVTAAVYAATSHQLVIGFIILAAVIGAVLGDNLGFLLGRAFGFRLAVRHGHRIGLDERRLKIGQYLFLQHGGKVVFFGRFIVFLRACAAFLAGTNAMPWRRFMVYNALGGVAWATLMGSAGYLFGTAARAVLGSFSLAALLFVVVVLVGTGLLVRRHEDGLAVKAEASLPGPLADPAQPGWRT